MVFRHLQRHNKFIIFEMARIPAASEKEILEKVSSNDANGLQSMFAGLKLSSVDFVDENGMTPLQHACYKGNKEIAQMLLDQVIQVLCFS